jgi:hypothetical protein
MTVDKGKKKESNTLENRCIAQESEFIVHFQYGDSLKILHGK